MVLIPRMGTARSRASGGRVRIRMRLPTGIPGVSVRMRGTVRYRVPDQRIVSADRPILRLAAVQAVYRIAGALTRSAVPGEDHDLGTRVSLALAVWQHAPLEDHLFREHSEMQRYPNLQVRARVRLRFSRADRKRVAAYHTARRLRHSEAAVQRDQLDCFLSDTATARAWWTKQHGISPEAQEVFDRFFLPLVRGNSPQDRETRIAAILASALRRIEHSSADYPGFLRTANALLRRYGQADLADQLPDLAEEVPQEPLTLPSDHG